MFESRIACGSRHEMGLTAANALRPLAVINTQGAPVAAVRLDKNAAGFRRGRPNVPYSEAPAHRGPRHHTAAVTQARYAPLVND